MFFFCSILGTPQPLSISKRVYENRKSVFWGTGSALDSTGSVFGTGTISIGFITGLFSQFGDFSESYFKRKLGVKDSSNLLLGHGGFLDRFDSMFAVSFATYFYLLLTGYHG